MTAFSSGIMLVRRSKGSRSRQTSVARYSIPQFWRIRLREFLTALHLNAVATSRRTTTNLHQSGVVQQIFLAVVALAMAFAASETLAQNSSLLYQGPMAGAYQIPGYVGQTGRGQSGGSPTVPLRPYDGSENDQPPITLEGASWTYQVPPPLRVFQINDVVTIRVDEITRVLAEGSAESRKRTLFEAILTDWIRVTDFRLRPDPQGNGDPAVATESNQQYRAESTVESRESMAFNIAATVVDIRPNGSLVLEARKTIRVNDNLWETSLSGLCRAADIAPDNVVLSKDLIDLEIRKMDRGHLRDGYKRGWFSRWLDRVQPF